MSRIIHTDSPGKIRNQLKRTCAELLRRLSQKQAVDQETKDMAAYLTLCLRQIEQGIEDSAAVWEKRDYWMKAEQLRQRWYWVSQAADQIEQVIRRESWAELPELLARLFAHFVDVRDTRFTRSADLWNGAYERFLRSNH